MVGGRTAAVLLGVTSWNSSIQLVAFEKITMTHTQTTCPNRITLHMDKKGVHPVEVGTLAPMFEKSATELKQKQKLLKCKSSIQIATFLKTAKFFLLLSNGTLYN